MKSDQLGLERGGVPQEKHDLEITSLDTNCKRKRVLLASTCRIGRARNVFRRKILQNQKQRMHDTRLSAADYSHNKEEMTAVRLFGLPMQEEVDRWIRTYYRKVRRVSS